MRKNSISTFIILSLLFVISNGHGWTQETEPFTKIEIEAPFYNILKCDPEFMKEGGARVIESEDGRMALIGIGKVFPEKFHAELMPEIRRKGEIRARTAILELGEDIEISTSRGLEEKSLGARHSAKRISLSSFFQTTETRVEGLIQQMPIIGTWWSKNYGTFYVAVGKIMTDEIMNKKADRHLKTDNEPCNMYLLEGGEEPYLSLLSNSPNLCKNGGVRGFILEDNRKILIAVNSATIQSSLILARKIARLKAIRSLLAHREGIQVSSVESLTDKEYLMLSGGKEQHVMISQFLSIQEEQVSGAIKAMPVVAVWKDQTEQILYVAIGKIKTIQP